MSRPLYLSERDVLALLDGRLAQVRVPERGPGTPCSLGAVGGVLWVREKWRPWIRAWSSHVQYAADGKRGESLDAAASDAAMAWCAARGGMWDDGRGMSEADAAWSSPAHMPRWASRFTLEIVGVSLRPLHDCTPSDAIAENRSADSWRPWNARYGRHGGWAWQSNPMTHVVTFKRVRE